MQIAGNVITSLEDGCFYLYIGNRNIVDVVAEYMPDGGYFKVQMDSKNKLRHCVIEGSLEVYVQSSTIELQRNGWTVQNKKNTIKSYAMLSQRPLAERLCAFFTTPSSTVNPNVEKHRKIIQ